MSREGRRSFHLSRRDFEVLNAIVVLQSLNDAFPLSIKRHLGEATTKDVSVGYVYAAIQRLEEAGLIFTDTVPGGEARSYRDQLRCRVTDAGRIVHRDWQERESFITRARRWLSRRGKAVR